MENPIDNKAERAERLRELDKLLNAARRLSTEEYKGLLKEVRNSYTIMLAMKAAAGVVKDTGAYLHVIEKVHYLLESIEGKPSQRIAIDHKVQTENKLHLRKLLSDPNNLGSILELEGMILDQISSPPADVSKA